MTCVARATAAGSLKQDMKNMITRSANVVTSAPLAINLARR